MTINTAPSDEDDSTPNEIGYLPDTAVPEEVPPYTTPPIPGSEILRIVYDEVIRLAKKIKESGEGIAPKYILVRLDIYLLAMGINNATEFLRIVNTEYGLDCTMLPFLPRANQSPFVVGYSYEETKNTYIASFKEGTFQPVVPEETPPAECDAVETSNG